MDLISHLDDRINTRLYDVLKINLVPFIKNCLHLEISEREILNIAGILDTNCFEVFVPSKQIKVRGIYPTTAMMAHECIPNTKHFIDTNFEMKVIACTDIKKGEMILTTYSHALQTTIERRMQIKTAKCFDCICPRCADPTEFETFASSIKCNKEECSGNLISKNSLDYQADWKCTKCSASISISQVIEKIKRIRGALDSLDKRSVEECEKFLTEFNQVLPSSSVFLIDVKYALCLLIGNNANFPIENLSLKLLNRKIELCNEILHFFNVFEPGNSNSVANVKFELSLAKIAQFKSSKAFEKNVNNNEIQNELSKAQESYKILIDGSEWKSLIENRMKKVLELCKK